MLAAFHQVVILRAGERVACRRCVTISTPRAEPQRVGRAERVGVEPGAVADASGARAAVAEVHGDAVVGMADDEEQRSRGSCGRW